MGMAKIIHGEVPTMDIDTEQQITDLFYAADLDPDQIIWDYSGRGMYGKTCMGYVTDNVGETLFALGMAVGRMEASGEHIDEDLVEALSSGGNTDNMGMSTIVYWRNISGKAEA